VAKGGVSLAVAVLPAPCVPRPSAEAVARVPASAIPALGVPGVVFALVVGRSTAPAVFATRALAVLLAAVGVIAGDAAALAVAGVFVLGVPGSFAALVAGAGVFAVVRALDDRDPTFGFPAAVEWVRAAVPTALPLPCSVPGQTMPAVAVEQAASARALDARAFLF